MKTQKDTVCSDFSKSNPALHLLYVKWAIVALTVIDKSIKKNK